MTQDSKYNIEKTLKDIYHIFGEDTTKGVEKIYRLETNNFSSGQFLKTYSAGMEATPDSKGVFPYGWGSLRKFWNEQPNNKPTGILKMKENKTGKEKMFIIFPNLFSAMFALAYTIKNRGGDVGSWYSTLPEQKLYYAKLLSSQKTTVTDKVKAGLIV
jgi:hypothetical protein